ncbi:uncharacterized protein LY79DRAFT_362734 [Colletotrichum navitas]|uniref:Uncharacterized protein n=1 Tax=Colletotrichum navitas TaxID=681940 RepID=A0AAD8PRR1_9PEZI|nr:uncharacterized protein LY79DRAFT_362734 [Colletotrichum navitas]KAK1574698.1 hypothetical protein LY79DRAFT_362734 [Colletotrichum navitas]
MMKASFPRSPRWKQPSQLLPRLHLLLILAPSTRHGGPILSESRFNRFQPRSHRNRHRTIITPSPPGSRVALRQLHIHHRPLTLYVCGLCIQRSITERGLTSTALSASEKTCIQTNHIAHRATLARPIPLEVAHNESNSVSKTKYRYHAQYSTQ